MAVGRNALAYNSLWQFRNDSWSSLEEAGTQLVLAGTQCRPTDPPAGTVSGLLDALAPIERFWAFPGAYRFQEMRRLFAAGKYDRLMLAGAKVTYLDAYWKASSWSRSRSRTRCGSATR